MILRDTRRWVALGAVVVFVGGVALGLSVRATSLWSQAEALSEQLLALDVSNTLETDALTGLGLAETRQGLMEAQAELASLAQNARWWLRTGSGLHWVPWIGADLAAPSAMVRAASLDILAAGELLEAGEGLTQLVSPGDDAWATLAMGQADILETAQQAKRRFQQASHWLIEAEAWHEKLRTNPPSGRLQSRVLFLVELHWQMVDLADWGESAVELLPKLTALAQQAQEVQRHLTPGEGETRGLSVLSLIQELEELTSYAEETHQGTLALLQETPPRLKASSIWVQLQDAERVLGAVLQMGDAILEAVQALGPALDLVDDGGFSLLGGSANGIKVVNALADRHQPLEDAARALDDARADLPDLADGVTGLSFLREVDVLRDMAEETADLLRFASNFFPVAAALLGAETPQRYLVLGHSADELRATGGYISSLWLVTVAGGNLTEVRYFDTVAVDDPGKLASYPTPPLALWQHMNAPVWLLRDVSWDPDFPTAAQYAQEMFWLGQDVQVDGVIGINQWALGDLLSALGPIPIPGETETINAGNFMPFLERGKDNQGREYLDVVLQGILEQLQDPTDLEGLFRLATAARQVLDSKGVLLFMDNPGAQRLLEQQGWTGSLYDGPGDHLLTVDSNVGWNKVDRNIRRQADYSVDPSNLEAPQAQLTLTYTNESGPDATGCSVQWGTESQTGLYGEYKEACYWDFLRVYLPNAATLISSTPLPLPPGSVADLVGFAQTGDETLKLTNEDGRTVLSGLFTLAAGETRQLRFDYQLGPQVLEWNGELITYTLTLQKQPGVQQRDTTVEVTLPEGYVVLTLNQEPVATQDQVLSFAFPMTQDLQLQITMGPS